MLPIIDIYRLNPRGPQFSTERITGGKGIHRLDRQGRLILDDVQLDPFNPPQTTEIVVLVSGRHYLGLARLHPDGSFTQDGLGEPSPWTAIPPDDAPRIT